MPTGTTGGWFQPGLIERGHLDQFRKLNPLHQQLGDPVATVDFDRRGRVQVDQRDLYLTTIARVDGARTIDNRKPHPRSQTRPRMDQAHHAERNRHRDPGGHQSTLTRPQLDIDGAVEIDPGVTGMSTARQWQIRIQANNRKTG